MASAIAQDLGATFVMDSQGLEHDALMPADGPSADLTCQVINLLAAAIGLEHYRFVTVQTAEQEGFLHRFRNL